MISVDPLQMSKVLIVILFNFVSERQTPKCIVIASWSIDWLGKIKSDWLSFFTKVNKLVHFNLIDRSWHDIKVLHVC